MWMDFRRTTKSNCSQWPIFCTMQSSSLKSLCVSCVQQQKMLSTIVNATTGEYIGRDEVGHFNSSILIHTKLPYTGWPKNWYNFFVCLNFTEYYRFSKLFHCQNYEKICNNTITKDPTTPQVCRYTTLWNVHCLRRSNNWKQDDFCNN